MKTERIVILAGYSFPVGMAATTRIIAYSAGLMEHGIRVDVINYGHESPEKSDYPDAGRADGVPYRYAYKRQGSRNTLRRRIADNLISRYKTFRLIRKMNREQTIDYIFLSFDAVSTILCFVLPLYLMGYKLIFIGDEYPIPIRERLKEAIPRWKRLFYNVMSRFLAGRVLMTENLKNFYNEIYPRPTHLLSNIIHADRFTRTGSERAVRENRICYMGNLELSKDNVDNIIRAFAMIKDEFPDLVFTIYGPVKKPAQTLVRLVAELGLTKRVLFMGRVGYEEVPAILQSSLLLVSSQPRTKRAQGGFPTKLGEYLLSGTPTLLTDVGEISRYVVHGREAWLARPCDPDDFARKMSFILTHYQEALKVAETGRRYVLENFTAAKATEGMILFLNNLKSHTKF